MIVHQFNIKSMSVTPMETNAPLAVDPDTELPLSIAFQSLQSICRRHLKVFQLKGIMDHFQFTPGRHQNFTRKTSNPDTMKQCFRMFIGKGFNHTGIVNTFSG